MFVGTPFVPTLLQWIIAQRRASIRSFLRDASVQLPSRATLPSSLAPLETHLSDRKSAWDRWVYEQFPVWEAWDLTSNPDHTPDAKLTQNPLAGVAVEEWPRLSNGRIEAVEVSLAEPISPDNICADFIAALGLACLSRDTTTSDLDGIRRQFARLRPEDGFLQLFYAAANPCAYGPGSGKKLGRLKAWISTAGLVGAPLSSGWSAIGYCAEQSHWYWFCANSDWFYGQDWGGLGLFVLRPDRRSAGILAAVDTD